MLFLASFWKAEWDPYVTIGIVVALAIVLAVAVIRKAAANKKAAEAAANMVVEEAEPDPLPTAPGSAGKLKLYNVEPKTAAMIMAIVADKLQKPLNELRFISIKEVE